MGRWLAAILEGNLTGIVNLPTAIQSVARGADLVGALFILSNDARRWVLSLLRTPRPSDRSFRCESPTMLGKICVAYLLPEFPPAGPSATSTQTRSCGESAACARSGISETAHQTPPSLRPPRRRRRGCTPNRRSSPRSDGVS